jgi:hypothetical protein
MTVDRDGRIVTNFNNCPVAGRPQAMNGLNCVSHGAIFGDSWALFPHSIVLGALIGDIGSLSEPRRPFFGVTGAAYGRKELFALAGSFFFFVSTKLILDSIAGPFGGAHKGDDRRLWLRKPRVAIRFLVSSGMFVRLLTQKWWARTPSAKEEPFAQLSPCCLL